MPFHSLQHGGQTGGLEGICQKLWLDGMEVADAVFESEYSVVFDQAENCMHSSKAIMGAALGD